MVLCPLQIETVVGLMTAVGSGLTVTVDEVEPVHVFASVTVTLYVVVVVGLTVIAGVVAALLQL